MTSCLSHKCAVTGTLPSRGTLEGAPSDAKRRDKKREREAAIQAEVVKKYGKATAAIRMAKFFAGEQPAVSRQHSPAAPKAVCSLQC